MGEGGIQKKAPFRFFSIFCSILPSQEFKVELGFKGKHGLGLRWLQMQPSKQISKFNFPQSKFSVQPNGKSFSLQPLLQRFLSQSTKPKITKKSDKELANTKNSNKLPICHDKTLLTQTQLINLCLRNTIKFELHQQ